MAAEDLKGCLGFTSGLWEVSEGKRDVVSKSFPMPLTQMISYFLGQLRQRLCEKSLALPETEVIVLGENNCSFNLVISEIETDQSPSEKQHTGRCLGRIFAYNTFGHFPRATSLPFVILIGSFL